MTEESTDASQDRARLTRALDLWGDAVYRLALRRTSNKEDAEDITQTVFLRFYRQSSWSGDDEYCKAWLLRVTMNCCEDLRRSAWKKKRVSLDAAEEPHDHLNVIPSRVEEAVNKLPEKQRSVIHLFYEEGYQSDEIALITNEKPSTVRSHLHRARETLRKALGGSYGTE